VRRSLVGAIAFLLLPGCGQQTAAQPIGADAANEAETLVWTKAAGGGEYAMTSRGWGSGNTSYESAVAYRCWKAAKGYDCLSASSLAFGGSISGPEREFARFHAETLPTTKDEAEKLVASDGYSCSYREYMGGIFSETIMSGGNTLIRHSTGIIDYHPWPKTFVQHYLIANSVRGTGYFDCERLSQAIHHGSLATMKTTTIRRSWLD